MIYHGVKFPTEPIASFCKKHYIRRLSLFGSILRDDFKQGSDIDVLVEFEEGRVPSLFGIAGMEIELTEILGRRVDLRTPNDLSRYFRDEVIETAIPQYAR